MGHMESQAVLKTELLVAPASLLLTTPNCHDNVLRSVVSACGQRLDFTPFFEDIVLSIVPSCCFIVLALGRLYSLRKRKVCVDGRIFRWSKLLVLFTYTLLHFGSIIALATDPNARNALAVTASALAAVCALLSCILSFIEHSKSVGPSTVLIVYLLLTALLDAIRARTLWTLHPPSAYAYLFTVSIALKVFAILLESTSKSKYILSSDDKSSLETSCSVLGLAFSVWLMGILRHGAQNRISNDDLADLSQTMSAEYLESKFNAYWTRIDVQNRSANSIVWCCCRVLFVPLVGAAPLKLAIVLLTICQPLLLQSLLAYLANPTNASQNVGEAIVAGYVVVYLGLTVLTNLFWYIHLGAITKLRGCLVGAIGRHTTKVDVNLLQDRQSPLTLMSNDVEHVVMGMRHFHDVWGNLVQAGLAIYFLERQVGLACIVPIAITVLTSVVVIYVTGAIGLKQVRWMEAVQQRIGAISKLISSLKSIKMKGLEDKSYDSVDALRSQDIDCGNSFRRVIASVGFLSFVPEFCAPFLMFAALVYVPQVSASQFDATRIFTSLSLLLTLAQPMTNFFQALPSVLAGFGSLKRIGAFLLHAEQHEYRSVKENTRTSSSGSAAGRCESGNKNQITISGFEVGADPSTARSYAFQIQQGSFGWEDRPDIVQNLSVTIPLNSLTMVIGPVGSGKTTLCESFLGQTRLSKGNLDVRVSMDEIAYCSQTPHLVNASVRDNIVAQTSYDDLWYLNVLREINLLDEVLAMPNQHNTLVGSSGANLSGGQKQRLALARAIYARRSICILDDILSGLDRSNSSSIFDRVIGSNGLLRQQASTVILVTHSMEHVAAADHIIALTREGKLAFEGSYDSFKKMPEFDQYTKMAIREQSGQSPILESEDTLHARTTTCQDDTKVGVTSSVSKVPSNIQIYHFYAQAVKYRHVLLLLFFSLAAPAFWNFSTLWLKAWVDYSEHHGPARDRYFLNIYIVLQCSTLLLITGVALQALTNVASNSGRALHRILLRTVLSAPIACLTALDSGQIINRFSQDIMLIDLELPIALMNFVVCVGTILGQGTLIVISSPFVGLSFPPLLLVLYFVQVFYLKTSKQLRMLDLESKSPLHTFFLDTVSGLSTIRAFNWTEYTISQLFLHIDYSQKPVYYLFMVQQWLNLALDLVVSTVAIIIVVLAVQLDLRGSSTGVALLQVISLHGMLRQIIVSWTTMETSIGAVTRIKEFSEETLREQDLDKNAELSPKWPEHGRIEINAISAVYQYVFTRNYDCEELVREHEQEICVLTVARSRPSKTVLRDLSLSIQAGEKIGLCGRSGSGKSSLALSLCQMIGIVSGSIIIDGVDISTLSPKNLRTLINVVPQDTCFVHGTIRLNLQPPEDDCIQDQALVEVLRKVKLWDLVEKHGGLDAKFDPALFSHGQRQLLCLAGSLLRPSRVVILDEFTSSVDHETDALMQRLIRETFEYSTVISIAHRLDTVMDFDRVIVLENGTIVESGPPRQLLQKGFEHSAFARLVDVRKADVSQ